MQPGRGLIQHQQLVGQRALPQVFRQLDALRLAARQGGRGLAQRQVAQADIAQRLQDLAGGPPAAGRQVGRWPAAGTRQLWMLSS